jgi:hypothetical protein
VFSNQVKKNLEKVSNILNFLGGPNLLKNPDFTDISKGSAQIKQQGGGLETGRFGNL